MMWCSPSSHVNLSLNYSFNSSFYGFNSNLCFGSNLLLIKFVAICVSSCSLLLHDLCLKMSPFKKSTVKRGSSKGNELVIDLDSLSLSQRRLDLRLEFMTTFAFRSYVAYQAYLNHFKGAPMLMERVVEQGSLLDTNI